MTILTVVHVSIRSVGRRFTPGAQSVTALFAVTIACCACSDAAEFDTRRSTSHPTVPPSALMDAAVPSAEPTPSATSPRPTIAPMPTAPPPIDEVGDVYDDPGCPEAMQRVEESECDPLDDALQCDEGMGCFPYVDYPSAPCAPETFGARCAQAGTGTQGEPCSQSLRCAHGFLCVVTSRGTECAELCKLPGENTCAAGFICGSLDIDGYGVCI